MKTLQEHLTESLNESLINEAYKPKFNPKDWENVLNGFKPAYSNYSQLGGIETIVDDGGDDNDIEYWINTMISGGVQDTPENREILSDIIHWACDNYDYILLGWRDDMESILNRINNPEPGSWGVSEEDYAAFMNPKKRLTGINKKYGEVLADKGNSGDLEEIASQYGDENW